MSAEIAHRLQLDLVVRDLNQPPEAKDPDRNRTTTAEAPGIPTSRVIGRGQSPRLGLCGGLRRHIDVLENERPRRGETTRPTGPAVPTILLRRGGRAYFQLRRDGRRAMPRGKERPGTLFRSEVQSGPIKAPARRKIGTLDSIGYRRLYLFTSILGFALCFICDCDKLGWLYSVISQGKAPT